MGRREVVLCTKDPTLHYLWDVETKGQAESRFGEPSLRGREALMGHTHIHWAVPQDG